LNNHYSIYGRNYFSRYDYEEVDGTGASKMMELLRSFANDASFVGRQLGEFTVKTCDDFSYTDPIDGSVSTKQGVRIIFADGSRVVFRLSGTGSQGATIRLYVEKYDRKNTELDPQLAIKSLIDVALSVSRLEEFTGRKSPTVIT
jgi:phosphoglucomutase